MPCRVFFVFGVFTGWAHAWTLLHCLIPGTQWIRDPFCIRHAMEYPCCMRRLRADHQPGLHARRHPHRRNPHLAAHVLHVGRCTGSLPHNTLASLYSLVKPPKGSHCFRAGPLAEHTCDAAHMLAVLQQRHGALWQGAQHLAAAAGGQRARSQRGPCCIHAPCAQVRGFVTR